MNNHFPWLQEILAHVHPSAHPTLTVSPLAVLWEAPLPVESLTDPKSALHLTSLSSFSASAPGLPRRPGWPLGRARGPNARDLCLFRLWLFYFITRRVLILNFSNVFIAKMTPHLARCVAPAPTPQHTPLYQLCTLLPKISRGALNSFSPEPLLEELLAQDPGDPHMCETA